MKFFHLSDLHIGKQLHHYNLREDQEHILAEVLSYAASIHPDAIVIAGDIYDKSVPSGEAVSLFDEFLTALAKIEPVIPVLIISGNHDSAQRLDYASRLLGSHQIYIAGQAPEEEADRLGLKLGMHICDGFALAGGPWITPEESMQKVVWSDTIVNGGKLMAIRLP